MQNLLVRVYLFLTTYCYNKCFLKKKKKISYLLLFYIFICNSNVLGKGNVHLPLFRLFPVLVDWWPVKQDSLFEYLADKRILRSDA